MEPPRREIGQEQCTLLVILPAPLELVQHVVPRGGDLGVRRSLAQGFQGPHDVPLRFGEALGQDARRVRQDRAVVLVEVELELHRHQQLPAVDQAIEHAGALRVRDHRQQHFRRAVIRMRHDGGAERDRPDAQRRHADRRLLDPAKRLDRAVVALGRGTAGQSSERALDLRAQRGRVEIPHEHERHVAGDVVLLEEPSHPRQRGKLEMLHLAEHAPRPVRVAGKERLRERLVRRHEEPVHRAILLLVHGLQFRGKQAKYGLHEPFRRDVDPRVDLRTRECIVIHRHVGVRECIDLDSPHFSEQTIEFVRDRIFRRLAPGLVDAGTDRFVLARRGLAQLLEQRLELRQFRLLRTVVHRAEPLRALEQHVLEVVRHPGVIGRIVATPRTHHDRAEHLRAVVRFAQDHRQPVRQHELDHLRGVSFRPARCGEGFVRRGCRRLCGRRGGSPTQDEGQRERPAHRGDSKAPRPRAAPARKEARGRRRSAPYRRRWRPAPAVVRREPARGSSAGLHGCLCVGERAPRTTGPPRAWPRPAPVVIDGFAAPIGNVMRTLRVSRSSAIRSAPSDGLLAAMSSRERHLGSDRRRLVVLADAVR